MAVVCGGPQGATLAWNAADDAVADRLLALQDQEGLSETWTVDAGVILERRISHEINEIDVGVNVYGDGVTNGTNTFTSATGPFLPSMLGLTIYIQGHGTRVITQVTSANSIEFSGNAIAADTGIVFSTTLGQALFEDGETGSLAGTATVFSGVPDNILYSPSAPFDAQLLGRRVVLRDFGSREVTAVNSANEIEFDGAPVAAGDQRVFTLPVVLEEDEHQLLAGGKVIASQRRPDVVAATIVRWAVGGNV